MGSEEQSEGISLRFDRKNPPPGMRYEVTFFRLVKNEAGELALETEEIDIPQP